MFPRRCHRAPPPPSPWIRRAGCAAALAGVVALGLCARPKPPVVVTPAFSGLCPALQVIGATAFYDRVAPPGASGDVEEVVSRINAEMATVREQIEEACRG